MKKNFLFSVMALFMLLFAASCSQEEILSADKQEGGKVSLSVNIPVKNPVTRANPVIPSGYKLRCILQLVNASTSAAIEGHRYVEEVASGGENVIFAFTAPSEAYKCLLWADYVKVTGKADITTAADNIYTTTDLKAIGYTQTAGAEMFNNDAADAFYGCILDGSKSAELKRPFTRIAFASSDVAYKDYTKIAITNLPAPKGFNAMSGTTTGNAEIASSELEIKDGKWFSTYLFTNTSAGTLGKGNDITFTLKKTDNTTIELKFAGEDITLTPNYDVTADVTPDNDDQTKVTVTFPGDMIDPDAPEKPQPMAVGDYINKDGSHSKIFNAEKAIAIVYALTDGKTDGSEYGTGKTPAGYAMALTSVTPERQLLGSSATEPITLPMIATTETEPWAEGDYNGYKYSAPLLEAYKEVNSKIFIVYNEWVTANSISATNLSAWYIPSSRQMTDMAGKILGLNREVDTNKVSAITQDAALKAAFEAKNISAFTTKDPANMMTSSINEANSMYAMQIGYDTETGLSRWPLKDGKPTTTFINSTWAAKTYFNIRPVLTIFAADAAK